ncbi:MAG: aspartyl/asparaginyl beta-hydroxylase domain-containing protein [Flavisolibacter sp.]
MIQYARLLVPLNLGSIKKEVEALTSHWLPHFNLAHYSGGWSILPLRSPGGNSEQIIPDLLSQTDYRDTVFMEQCPSIQKVVEFFHCELKAVRLMNLKSGSIIKPHRDTDLCFEKGEARLHIPIFTNDHVRFFSVHQLLSMKEGECWYVNVNLEHQVSNEGSSDRVHLVIDCVVNEWLRNLFLGAECKQIPDEDRSEEKRKIIKELRRQNTETGTRLADMMEAELNQSS